MPNIDPFEHHASHYEEWFERNQVVYYSELEAIRKLIPPNGEGVEIGVGSGRFAGPLGIKLGIEPAAKMREIAVKRGIKVLDGIAELLPFDNSQLDFALMVTTICFLDDIEAAFKEVYRILKHHGSFIIGFVDRESPLGKLYEQNKEANVFYRVATFYSVNQIIAYLKNAGFKNFSFNQTIFHNLAKITTIEPIKKGYGEGSFVTVKAIKP